MRSITREGGTPRSPLQLVLPSLHFYVNMVQNEHDNEIKVTLLCVQSQLTVNTLSKSTNLSACQQDEISPGFSQVMGHMLVEQASQTQPTSFPSVNTVNTHIHTFMPSHIATWQPTSIFLPGESPWTEEPDRLHRVTKSWT